MGNLDNTILISLLIAWALIGWVSYSVTLEAILNVPLWRNPEQHEKKQQLAWLTNPIKYYKEVRHSYKNKVHFILLYNILLAALHGPCIFIGFLGMLFARQIKYMFKDRTYGRV